MKQFEYIFITLRPARDGAWGGKVHPARFRESTIIPRSDTAEGAWADVLNHYGAAGWELWRLEGDTAIMKRTVDAPVKVQSETKAKFEAEVKETESFIRRLENQIKGAIR
jgi:hypothetical protein